MTQNLATLKIIEFKKNQELSQDIKRLLLEADPNLAEIKSYFPGASTLLAYLDNHIVGVCVLVNDSAFEIKNIAVHADFRNQGIGKRLIQASMVEAKKMGASEVFIGTGNSSLQQLAFYQRLGFRFDGIKKNLFAHYDPQIIENNILCLDLVMLKKELQS